jgi:hypothetical protein
MIKQSFAKFVTLGVALLIGSSALAADGKVYAGIACRQVGTAGTYSVFGGQVYNDSTTSALSLICPLTHDQTHIDSGHIVMYDRNSTAAVSCTVWEETAAAGGVLTQFSATVQTTNADSSLNPFVKPFSFPASTGNYTYVTCSVPVKTVTGASDIGELNIIEG